MRNVRHLFVLLLPLLVSACMTLEESGQGVNLLSPEQEQALGAKVAAEVEQKERILPDPVVQQYVTELGQRLVARVERTDVHYQFKVIDAPETVNAFALPGGYMYVYTGLMRLCENEAELAAVMAHEIAHVAAQHHGEAMTRAYGYQMLVDLVLGDSPRQAARIAADLAGTTGANYFSRGAEREADALGMRYLVESGYPPSAMVEFMQKMLSASPDNPKWLAFLSTHPATEARIASLRTLAAQYPPDIQSRTDTQSARYQSMVLTRLGQAAAPESDVGDEWKVLQD